MKKRLVLIGGGHAHKDTLDLKVFAHGSIMSGDFNQRPAYGRPRHQRSYVHNVVEVDGLEYRLDVVIAIRTLVQHLQEQVDLRVGSKVQFGHVSSHYTL